MPAPAPQILRHTLIAATTLVLAGAGALALPMTASAADAVVVSDANLKACLDDAFGVPEASVITKTQLVGITALDCHQRSIVDISPLQYASNMTNLNLSGNQIVSISGLAGATNLMNVNLSRNLITDSAPLGKDTKLTLIDVSSNRLTALNGVTSLSNLNSLDVRLNGLSSFPAAMSNLGNLVTLDASINAITSISGLAHVPQLSTLNLSGNQIASAAPLASELGLHTVDLSHNNLSTTTGLDSLPVLDSLDLSENHLATLPAIKLSSGSPALTLHQFVILPAVTVGTPTALPQLTTEILRSPVTISDASNVVGTIDPTGKSVTWFGVGTGQLEWNLVLNSYSGIFSQPVVPGTLTTATPTITGTPVVGKVLTAVAGTWGPAPVNLSYQWLRDGVAISGATSSFHTLNAADSGHAVSVKVTGAKYGYASASKASATVSVVTNLLPLTTTPTPTIAGTPTVGQVLTATPGTWAPAPVTLAYQWNRGGTPIAGATAKTYTLTNADAAQTITVSVTGSKSGYASVTKTSAATATITGGTLTTATPTITGTPTVSQVLTANPGAWQPSPVTFTYQWKRDGATISGATTSTFTTTATDAGHTITVTVTGSKPSFTTASKSSTGVVIQSILTATPTPTITGTPASGQKLTAKAGTWGPAPVTLAYQWNRNGTPIAGATASTYLLTSTDSGTTITVTVAGSKTGYATVSKTSAGLPIQAAA